MFQQWSVCHIFWKSESHYLYTPSVSLDWSINMILFKSYLSIHTGHVSVKKAQHIHILFCLHSHLRNWPCSPLTVNFFWCHRPHGIYTVVISFILCLVTNIWQQPLRLTWLYKLTKPIKSPWILKMPKSLNVYLSTKAHRSSFEFSVVIQRRKRKFPAKTLLLFFENSLLKIISHKRLAWSANHLA